MIILKCIYCITIHSFVYFLVIQADNKCQIHINNDLPREKSPLYLKRGYVDNLFFIIPNERGQINLDYREEIILACPGKNNGFQADRTSNYQSAICSGGNNIQIFGTIQHISKVTCINSVGSEVENTNIRCGRRNSNGYTKNVGFKVQNHWLNVIETCYDSNRGEVLYAVHTLVGKAQRVVQRMTKRPFFSTDGTLNSARLNNLYRKDSQIRTFSKILDSKTSYFNDESFLSRGHLVPSRDFPLQTLQEATFYYINVVPQWYQVNAGNWNEIEYLTRKLGIISGENYQIITGGLDILQLPYRFEQSVQINMDGNSFIPVPKYIWKIVINPLRRQGVVFIVSNNPFAANGHQLQSICNNVCRQVRFTNRHSQMWTNATLGLVTCCEVNEFSSIINYLPQLPPVDSLLHF